MNLDKLPLKALVVLQAKIATAIEDAKSGEREAIKAKIISLAAQSGFSVKDILGKHRKTSLVKFRNPSDPGQTWTGKGRRPAWFIKAGEDKCKIGV